MWHSSFGLAMHWGDGLSLGLPWLVGLVGLLASITHLSSKKKKSKKNKTSKHEGGKSLPSYSLGGGVWPLLKTFLGVARAAP
jgi:hypothetical protein